MIGVEMKRYQKTLFSLGIAGFTYQKIKALREKRSLRSLLIENLLKKMNIMINPFDLKEYQKALRNNSKEYVIPEIIKNLYYVKYLNADKNMIKMVPNNGVQSKIIFYIHGGAYWSQPANILYPMLNKLARMVNATIIMPIYPLAPNFHAKDTYNMILKCYLNLINNKGINPNNIILMGDSAGGGFSLAFLQKLRDNQLPMPLRAILLSPWLDITDSNPEMKKIQPFDPILNIKELAECGKIFAGDLDVKNPLVSPIYGNSDNLPPVDIFSGTHDILYADTLKLGRISNKMGWNINTHIYQKMDHVFSWYPTPEAQDSLEKIARLIL